MATGGRHPSFCQSVPAKPSPPINAPHGIILAPDDLRVGDLVAVYNLKNEPTELAPIMGQAITVTAIELPFLVGIPVSDPSKSPLTLDIRFLNFMRVSKEFAKAQTPRRTDD